MGLFRAPLLLFILVMVGCCTTRQQTGAPVRAIRAILDQQARDWNDGSIERFMQGYAKRADIRFASGGDVVQGWQTVFDRYVKKYGDRAAMGTLTFSEVDIMALSDSAAVAFGRWRLQRQQDQPSGLFTLVFRKLPEGWRIVHDHTSSAEKK